jgi:hypothetical protein
LFKTYDQLVIFIVRDFALNQKSGRSGIENGVILSTSLFIGIVILLQTSYQPRFCCDSFQMFKMVEYQHILASNGFLVNAFLEIVTIKIKRFPNEIAPFDNRFIKFIIVNKNRFFLPLLNLFWKTKVHFSSLNEL